MTRARRCTGPGLMLVGALTLGAGPALGAEPWGTDEITSSFGDAEFVTIATGRRQPVAAAPSVANVITRADIERMPAADLYDVLETVPGIHVSRSSYRLFPIVSIRGIHADKNPQVLMLANGVPLTQVFQGDRGFSSHIPLASIERIEVIRGPGSALYGADAFAGVINIVTRSPHSIDGTEVGVRRGSFDSDTAWLQNGQRWNGIDVGFSLEYQDSSGDDGRRVDNDAQSLFDGLQGTDASLAPGPLATRYQRLDSRLTLEGRQWTGRVWYWGIRDSGVGPGLAQALDPAGGADVDSMLADFTWKTPATDAGWSTQTRVSYLDVNADSHQVLYPPGAELPIGSDGNVDPSSSTDVTFTDGLIGDPGIFEEHARLDFSATWTGAANHVVRLASGAHYAHLDPEERKNYGPGVLESPSDGQTVDGALTNVTGTDAIYIPARTRRVIYASAQDEWRFAPDWNLTAGIRADEFSDFGSTVNPRLALVYNVRYDLTAKLLYGRAFRAPSFAELFTQNNPVIVGNEELDPEVINTLELAIDYQPRPTLHASASTYVYQVDDLIEFVPQSGNSPAMAENTRGVDGRGLELELDWRPADAWRLEGSLALQRAIDRRTDERLANAPGSQVKLQADWDFAPRWQASLSADRVADRRRAPDDPRPAPDDFTLTSLNIQRDRLFGGWSAEFLVTNLFDVDAVYPSPYEPNAPAGALIPGDYPIQGRAAYFTLKTEF